MNLTYALWLTVSGVVALLVAFLGWTRRSAPGALALMALMIFMTVWSLSYAAHWLSDTVRAGEFWLKFSYFGVVSVPVAFFALVQYFIGRGGWLKLRVYLFLSIIPVITLALLWTENWHDLFLGESYQLGGHMIRTGGPWFMVFVVYSYGLLLVSLALLLRAYSRSSHFFRRQARIMLLGGLLPWLTNIGILLKWDPLPGLDLTPIAFTATGLLLAYGFFGYRMMDLVPVARDVLVEQLDEAILVLDMQGRIVDINPKALEYADTYADLPVGRRLDEVFPRWSYLIPIYQSLEGRTEFRLEYPPYSFIELMVILLKDSQSQMVGRLVTWRDITSRKISEEKLRIFQHAVEQNPVTIVITDSDGNIEYTNPRFSDLTGYSAQEARGRNPRFLQSGETAHETYEMLWTTIKSGRVWEGEIMNRKKNGELFWVYQMIAPVLNDSGQATHFVAMQQDITLNRRSQEEVREVNKILQLQLSEVESLHHQLREEAIHDGLTHLYNRRYMEETLEREVSRVEREPRPISVVMMDVDLFKSINDTYGHQAGDSVLQTLGTMLLENTRLSNIACRYGGDEMLVVMPGATQEVALARARNGAPHSRTWNLILEMSHSRRLISGRCHFSRPGAQPNRIADRLRQSAVLGKGESQSRCTVRSHDDTRHQRGGMKFIEEAVQ